MKCLFITWNLLIVNGFHKNLHIIKTSKTYAFLGCDEREMYSFNNIKKEDKYKIIKIIENHDLFLFLQNENISKNDKINKLNMHDDYKNNITQITINNGGLQSKWKEDTLFDCDYI